MFNSPTYNLVFLMFDLFPMELFMTLDPYSTGIDPLSTFPRLSVGTLNLLSQDQVLRHLSYHARTKSWDP